VRQRKANKRSSCRRLSNMIRHGCPTTNGRRRRGARTVEDVEYLVGHLPERGRGGDGLDVREAPGDGGEVPRADERVVAGHLDELPGAHEDGAELEQTPPARRRRRRRLDVEEDDLAHPPVTATVHGSIGCNERRLGIEGRKEGRRSRSWSNLGRTSSLLPCWCPYDLAAISIDPWMEMGCRLIDLRVLSLYRCIYRYIYISSKPTVGEGMRIFASVVKVSSGGGLLPALARLQLKLCSQFSGGGLACIASFISCASLACLLCCQFQSAAESSQQLQCAPIAS
jgi:hypothetical protein